MKLLTSVPGRIIGLAALAIVLVACMPTFTGQTLVVKPSAVPGTVQLIWSPANDSDPGNVMWYYQIDVNGTNVANVTAPATSCTLSTLASGASYDISVTAWSWNGSAGEWSGNLGGAAASLGRLSTTYNSPAGSVPVSAITCSSPDTDTDGDHLPNWAETNTGVFVNAGNSGTNPNVADTDGDGIKDGDETIGTYAGLDLPSLGTNPLKKDILLEFDWFDDANDCASHSHRPTAAMISRLSTAFANAPVSNPNGSTGIHVIADYGQGAPFLGGNLVNDADGVITVTTDVSGFGGTEFINHKTANFAANRNGYFHYVLMPHRYNGSGSSGIAELPGDDLLVTLQCFNSTNNVANTIMHELGHNLNLRHGGNGNTNWKPNYNSIMNYLFQFPGVDTNCTPAGDGVLDYSRGTRASLNEASLNEALGICSNLALDWNGNTVLDPPGLVADINRDFDGFGDGLLSVLNDYNDWANISFGGLTDADGARVAPVEVVQEQPVPAAFRN